MRIYSIRVSQSIIEEQWLILITDGYSGFFLHQMAFRKTGKEKKITHEKTVESKICDEGNPNF